MLDGKGYRLSIRLRFRDLPKLIWGFWAWWRRRLLSKFFFLWSGPVLMISSFSFVSSGKPTHVLPHMPESKRNFVHDVSSLLILSY